MDRKADGEGSESRFASYVEHIASTLGHADRRTPFRSYCAGLILPGDRKSVEPIAARIEPSRVQGAHQSLHHFVANADWSQEDLLRRVRAFVLPAIEKSGRISAWIVDDTGFPKKGVHSVGVARQYCGQLGKQDNCQVAVSLSVANEQASLPIAFRLYLPEDWAADPVRRAKAGVPEDVVFKTKPQIALDQIKAARAEGVPEGVVLAEPGYGINTAFRTALTRMGLTYTTARCATYRAHRIARMGAGARSRLRISMIGSDHRDPVLLPMRQPGRPRSISPSSFDAFRQALWVVEFLELLLSGADAQAKLAKSLALDILLVRPRKHFAIVEPYLHYLFAVLGDEVGFGALRILGAAEKSVTCGPKKSSRTCLCFPLEFDRSPR